jgi:hypothetical protein
MSLMINAPRITLAIPSAVLIALTDIGTAEIGCPDFQGCRLTSRDAWGGALLAAVPSKLARFTGVVSLMAAVHLHGRMASLSSDILCLRLGDGER